MTDQIENAGPAGATSVDVALSAPPAASAMGVPIHAPEPRNDTTTATTALTTTPILMAPFIPDPDRGQTPLIEDTRRKAPRGSLTARFGRDYVHNPLGTVRAESSRRQDVTEFW